MNALTLDGSPVNSNIGRANTETFTAEDVSASFREGLRVGEAYAAHNWKGRAVDMAENFKTAMKCIDKPMSEEMRKTLDQALERAEALING